LLFQQAIGVKFTMIPYRGAGQSSADLVAGNIDVLLDTPALSLQQHRAGNVKAFAVADSHRLATAPDIPTTDEAGLPGFYFTFWHALWAPKGTPKDIVAKLNDAARKALQDPTIRKRLEDLSNEVFPSDQLTPEALAAFSSRRNREVVADHQGGRHQGAVMLERTRAPIAKLRADHAPLIVRRVDAMAVALPLKAR